MNDDKNNSSKINEFDFEEDTVKGKVVDQSMIGRASLPPRNSIVLGIVAVVILFLGVRFLFSGPKKSKPAPAQHVVERSVTPVPPLPPSTGSVKSLPEQQHTPVEHTSPAAAAPVPEPKKIKESIESGDKVVHVKEAQMHKTHTVEYGALEEVIKQLKEDIAAYQKKQSMMLETMNGNIDELKMAQKTMSTLVQQQGQQVNQQLDGFKDSQKDLRSKLDGVLTQWVDLQKQMKHIDELLVKQAAEFDVADDLRSTRTVSTMIVHAVIPGRAWLRDQHNKIFSVVEGDEIPGYGKVLTIDPRLGTVVTNSGQILRH
jgi:hypothetical protein